MNALSETCENTLIQGNMEKNVIKSRKLNTNNIQTHLGILCGQRNLLFMLIMHRKYIQYFAVELIVNI